MNDAAALAQEAARAKLVSMAVGRGDFKGSLTTTIKTAQNFHLLTTDSDFLALPTVAEETMDGLRSAAVSPKNQRTSVITVKAKGAGNPLVARFRLSLARWMYFLSSSYLHLRSLGYADDQIVSYGSLADTMPAP
jgi:hypothetical protein